MSLSVLAMVEPFALFEPLVEELTEGRSDPIRTGGSPLVDEVPECFVCGPGRPVEGLRAHLVLLGDRVCPQGDPKLPHTALDLTLRPTHESKRSEILGFILGFSWG